MGKLWNLRPQRFHNPTQSICFGSNFVAEDPDDDADDNQD